MRSLPFSTSTVQRVVLSGLMRSVSLLQELIVPVISQIMEQLTQILMQVSKVSVNQPPALLIQSCNYMCAVFEEPQQAALQPLSVRVALYHHQSGLQSQPANGGDVRERTLSAVPGHSAARRSR